MKKNKTVNPIKISTSTNRIIFPPSFQHSMYQLERYLYGNDKRQTITRTFEVKFHPKNATVLTRFLYRVSLEDTTEIDKEKINVLSRELRQVLSNDKCRSQIMRHNHFLHNIAIIPI